VAAIDSAIAKRVFDPWRCTGFPSLLEACAEVFFGKHVRVEVFIGHRQVAPGGCGYCSEHNPLGSMGRPLRPVADGLVYHAINRGNNRDRVFFDDGDFKAFLRALGQTQLRYPFELFGYALMSNHFHLLLRPAAGQSISRILQSLTVAHTYRYHRRHRTVGHVWQGRFKSPVIQDDNHLLIVLRYIEGNPLRARMVTDLKDYPWTSYAAHALALPNGLLTEPPPWSGLAANGEFAGPAQRARRTKRAEI
jgi:putative transposase